MASLIQGLALLAPPSPVARKSLQRQNSVEKEKERLSRQRCCCQMVSPKDPGGWRQLILHMDRAMCAHTCMCACVCMETYTHTNKCEKNLLRKKREWEDGSAAKHVCTVPREEPRRVAHSSLEPQESMLWPLQAHAHPVLPSPHSII